MAEGLNGGAQTRPPGAGRELVHATDEGAARPPLTAALTRTGTGPAGGRTGSPHSHKFRTVTALLVAVAAIALLVAGELLAQGRGHTSSQPWSSWTPADSGTLGATQIAAHIAPLYRASAADQLDVVTLMNVSNAAASAGTGGASSGSGSGSGGLTVAVNQGGGSSLSLLGGRTVAYNVCGVGGSDCQLGGSASSDRLLLLRREALELALYTFRYISGTDNVIVVLPPGHTQPAASKLSAKPPIPGAAPSSDKPVTVSVLFVRQELQPWLDQPLSETLQQFPPALSQLTLWKQTQEAGLVDQITARGLFSEKIEHAQDGGSLLMLNQLPPQ